MAESEQKDRALVLAPPPVLTVVCAAGGFAAHRVWPVGLSHAPVAIRVAISVVLALLAAAMVFSAIRQLVRNREHPSPYRPTDAIVASGIYRLTRNPIYVGLLLLVLAVASATNSAWLLGSFLALFLLLHFGVVKPEERYLSRKFGESYDQYRLHVRRWV